MRTVILHGDLAVKFIDRIDLEVSSIVEVLRALSANFKNFSNYIAEYKPGFFIKTGNIYRNSDTVLEPLLKDDTIHIIPAITGSGKMGMLMAGAFLIFITAGGASAPITAAMGTEGAALTVGQAAFIAGVQQIGVGLVLSGISAILFAPPKQVDRKNSNGEPNTYFNGAVNTISQGNPVSVGYGKLLIGSAVISSGISIDQPNSQSYSWLFTSVNNNGWITTNSTDVYYNTITGLKYDNVNESYLYTNYDSYSELDSATDQYLTRISKDVYRYSFAQNRFFILESRNNFTTYGSEYSQPGGSSTVPPRWATGVQVESVPIAVDPLNLGPQG